MSIKRETKQRIQTERTLANCDTTIFVPNGCNADIRNISEKAFAVRGVVLPYSHAVITNGWERPVDGEMVQINGVGYSAIRVTSWIVAQKQLPTDWLIMTSSEAHAAITAHAEATHNQHQAALVELAELKKLMAM
jgi:hypothetical protein